MAALVVNLGHCDRRRIHCRCVDFRFRQLPDSANAWFRQKPAFRTLNRQGSSEAGVCDYGKGRRLSRLLDHPLVDAVGCAAGASWTGRRTGERRAEAAGIGDRGSRMVPLLTTLRSWTAGRNA
jgi:hypothetical protein